ncbi:DUF6988 family protein [Luteimonas rhizosphaericola]|uniref:DUF6988 family protein n=1 Tax=Luteimonas rhizosphaericola TaxID=3042024 RepID=UPI003CE59741
MVRWEFDLGGRPCDLVDRSSATIALAGDALRLCAHQTPPSARQALVGSCLSFAIEQQNAVGLLVATGRDSAAAVLVRPILEALCISAWALYRASDDQLSSVFSGRVGLPSVTSLLSQLEAVPKCGWIGFEQKSLNVRAFHALAHPSMLQLSRRYAPDPPAGAFTAIECRRLLWLADTLMVTTAATHSVAANSNEIEAWAGEQMARLMRDQGVEWESWGKLPRSDMSFGLETPIAASAFDADSARTSRDSPSAM